MLYVVFFFKQKTAYEIKECDWSSDVCSSDLIDKRGAQVIAIQGDEVQLMDLETYEMFHVPIPEEFADAMEPGKDVQYLIAMDRKKITKV